MSTRKDHTQRPACTTSDSVSTAPVGAAARQFAAHRLSARRLQERTRLLQDALQQARQLHRRLGRPAKLRLRGGHGSHLDANVENAFARAVSERRRLRACRRQRQCGAQRAATDCARASSAETTASTRVCPSCTSQLPSSRSCAASRRRRQGLFTCAASRTPLQQGRAWNFGGLDSKGRRPSVR